MLFDFLAYDTLAADADLDGLDERLARQVLHLARKRGAEHDRLPIGPNVVEYLGDLRLEAHVEHAVGLVEHHVGDAAQIGDAAVVGRQHVDHAAGRAHDDFAAALELGDLLGDVGAAVDGDHVQIERARELLALLGDLHGELARRRHDDRDRTVVALQRRLIHDVAEHGQEEGQRLAAARLRNADHVATGHDDRHALRLNRCRLVESVP